jgi:hypothetical protein
MTLPWVPLPRLLRHLLDLAPRILATLHSISILVGGNQPAPAPCRLCLPALNCLQEELP